MTDHVDVLIIGAGLSGIGAAAHLTRTLPRTSYAVLEARAVSGGTWDLFRYPGIRSDSDMYTMGYRFKPWTDEESLGRGDRILAYLRETAREYDVDAHIRYDHRVVRASWDSAAARWTVEAEHARRDGDDHRGLPLELSRLLRLRARSRAGVRRRRGVPRPDRPSAALARRPRVGGPERRGHRQRRDRGDAGAGHGRGRRARDDAAALAVVRHEPGRPRPGRARPAQAAPAPRRPTG